MNEEIKLSILLAEDDEAAASLIKRNIRRSGIDANFIHAKDGQEVIDILNGTSLINTKVVLLLDLKMPKLNGLQVLEIIKVKNEFKKIPVIMLTTSDRNIEIELCYNKGCNFYIKKQVDYQKFMERITHIINFVKICELPIFKEVKDEV